MRNIACESTHTHTHIYTHFVPRVNRRELDVNVPPFSFNRPLETVQRAFCWLIGEIRSTGGRGGVEGFRDSQSQLFFYRMEAPLSIGTHLPCCVIVAHNGAHLIEAAQGFFFFFPEAIFSIHSQTSHVLKRYYTAF